MICKPCIRLANSLYCQYYKLLDVVHQLLRYNSCKWRPTGGCYRCSGCRCYTMDHHFGFIRVGLRLSVVWCTFHIQAFRIDQCQTQAIQGQYHFTYILAPEKHRNFAAFAVGTLNVIAWWIVTCSGISLGTISTLGMISFWNPSFQATQWQTYLIFDLGIILTRKRILSPVFSALTFFTVIPIFLIPNRHMGRMTQFCLHLSLVGFLLVFITILAMCDNFQSGSTIAKQGSNSSGRPDGIAWILGIGNALYAYGGTDAVIHISEEITHPGKRLPQVM